jgi:hypothetical protein
MESNKTIIIKIQFCSGQFLNITMLTAAESRTFLSDVIGATRLMKFNSYKKPYLIPDTCTLSTSCLLVRRVSDKNRNLTFWKYKIFIVNNFFLQGYSKSFHDGTASPFMMAQQVLS